MHLLAVEISALQVFYQVLAAISYHGSGCSHREGSFFLSEWFRIILSEISTLISFE